VVQLTGKERKTRLFDIEDFILGLNNDMLSAYKPFNRDTVKAMEAFLNDFQKPLCFVGKNMLNNIILIFISNRNLSLHM